MTRDRLLIVNHFDTVLELQLLWPLNRRQQTTPCRIPLNGVVDLCTLLPSTLTKDQVRSITENSPDFIKARKKFRVEIVDESNRPEPRVSIVVPHNDGLRFIPTAKTSETVNAPPVGDSSGPVFFPESLPLPSKPGTTVQDGQRMLEEERAAAKAYLAAKEGMNGAARPDAQPGQPEPEAATPDASGALEPGTKETIADAIPSTRWTTEKLSEYASQRGIEVAGLSKNAILRKIRGA